MSDSDPPPSGRSPGWYVDPSSKGERLRWWNGVGWTDHLRPAAAAAQAPPKNRRAPIWPWLLAAVAGSLVAAAALVLAIVLPGGGSEHHAESTRANAGGGGETTETSPRRYEQPGSNRLPEVALGTAVVLRTQDSPRARVTPTALVDPVRAGRYLLRPKRGNRWVGVRLRFQNLGPGKLRDAPANGARLVASGGRSFKAGVADPDGCHALSAVVQLAKAESAGGCLVFEVPRRTRVTRLRMTLSSGYAPDVGTWRLAR